MMQRIITGAIFTVAVLALVVPAYFVPPVLLIFTFIVTSIALVELIKAAKNTQKEMSVPATVLGGYLGFLPLVFWLTEGTPSQ